MALPTGRLVTGNGGDHVAWATVDPVPESRRIWAARSELHPQTGLVPVQLDGLRPAAELTQVEQATVSLAVAEAPEPGRCDQRAHDCLFFAGEALNRSGGQLG